MRPKVYVVDDENAVRASLADLLDSEDFATDSFASVEEFLSEYPQHTADQPSCVIADLRMPGMGGLELKESLAAMQDDIPVILLTGFRDAKSDGRAEQLGVFAVLEKPYPPSELLQVVDAALSV